MLNFNMKRFSKLAWFGLTINTLVVVGVGYLDSLSEYELSKVWWLSREEKNLISMVYEVLCVAVFVQWVSVALFFRAPRACLIAACVSTIAIFPLGIFFLAGIIFSYSNECYGEFQVWRRDEKRFNMAGVKFDTGKMVAIGVITFLPGISFIYLGGGAGWILIFTGIYVMANAIRLRSKILLGVTESDVVITPSHSSKCYLIPLSKISITSEDGSKIKFRVKTMSGDRDCAIRKDYIDGEYKEILKLITKSTEEPEKRDPQDVWN